MARQITICGHTVVNSGTLTLGETDADNDISLKIFTPKRKIHTNLSGPEMVEAMINQGITGILTIPLTVYDPTVTTAICAAATGALAASSSASVGLTTVGAAAATDAWIGVTG